MKIAYIEKRFGRKSIEIIEKANAIIYEYEGQGFSLTLRQLYYQFVARDIIENTLRSYKRLGSIINDARLAGMINTYSIRDRTRFLRGNIHYVDPSDRITKAEDDYKINHWEGQDHYVEVWIEKDALVGVISRICGKLDVDYLSCRGYVSQSEMWAASQRLIRNWEESGMSPVIIHLGDHDPSGLDMTRDIRERLGLFVSEAGAEPPVVKRIALNMDQVAEYQPPPNPAKITDSRYAAYAEEYGNESWELDALEPRVISNLIEKNVYEYLDEGLFQERCELEEVQREILTKCSKKWSKVEKYLNSLKG